MGKIVPLFPGHDEAPKTTVVPVGAPPPRWARGPVPVPEMTLAARARRQRLWDEGRAQALHLLKQQQLAAPADLTPEDAYYYYLGLGQAVINYGDDARRAARGDTSTRW